MGYRGLAAGEAEFEVALERSAWGVGPWGLAHAKTEWGKSVARQRIQASVLEACCVGRGPFVSRGQHRVQ